MNVTRNSARSVAVIDSHRKCVHCVSICNNTDSFDAGHVVQTNRQTSSLFSACSKDEMGASATLGIALSLLVVKLHEGSAIPSGANAPVSF